MRKRRLTAEEFDSLLPYLQKINESRRGAARRALVAGDSLASIATDTGWSVQAVSQCVNAVMKARAARLRDLGGVPGSLAVPDGWKAVTVLIPDDAEGRLRQFVDDLAQEKKSGDNY